VRQHVEVMGQHISDYSRHVLLDIAIEARLPKVYITSVTRSTADQARIFYNKHVVEGKAAHYKNPDVAKFVTQARELKAKGRLPGEIKDYLLHAIEHAHGGPSAVSRHIGSRIFCEVFDVAHYSGSTSGPSRVNIMTNVQARAFLEGCRKRMPGPISRLGHSAELGFKSGYEFTDEKCFHMEISQLVFDRLIKPDNQAFA
jgi:hypothetical protein